MLPTAKTYPGFDLAANKNHSRGWPDDNIKTLGSEYTSDAWNDKPTVGWGNFVFEAHRDVRVAGAL